MLAQLIPVAGGEPITLDRDVTVVGRNRQLCDLHLNHSSVSKVHCIIVKTDGLLFLRDLGSSNGTRVNGQKVIRGALLPGDQIAIAAIKFKIHLGPDEADPDERPDQTEVIPAHRSPGSSMSRRPTPPSKRSPLKKPPGIAPSAAARPGSKSHSQKQTQPDSESDVRLLSDDDLASDDDIEIIE